MKKLIAITAAIMIASVFSIPFGMSTPVFAIDEDEYETEDYIDDVDEDYEQDDESSDEDYDDTDEDSNAASTLLIPAMEGTFDSDIYDVTQIAENIMMINGVEFYVGGGRVVVLDGSYAIYKDESREGFTVNVGYWYAEGDPTEREYYPGEIDLSEVEGVKTMNLVWHWTKNEPMEAPASTDYNDTTEAEADTDISGDSDENADDIDGKKADNTGEDSDENADEETDDTDESGGEEETDNADETTSDNTEASNTTDVATAPDSNTATDTDKDLPVSDEYGHCDFDNLNYFGDTSNYFDFSNNRFETYVMPTRSELREVSDGHYASNSSLGQYNHKPQTGDGFPMKVYLAAVMAFIAIVTMIVTTRRRSIATSTEKI